MEVYELVIKDETKDGVFAVSLVEKPAIEENFIALSEHEIELKAIDEKRIVLGAALIPNKRIFRKDKDKEFQIFFSKETVKRASELVFMRGQHQNATENHAVKVDGMTIVESWIIEDSKKDKSAFYEMSLPVGTWMIAMKVDNDETWEKVKKGEFKGFSIEGYFAERYEMSAREKIAELLRKEFKLESYTDYPEQATENAKIALRYVEENGWGSCGTPVGKVRANQLANREPISEDTISRMASFERHRENSQKELGDGCGRLMWLCWGGDAGIEWAQRKLEQIRKQELEEGQTHYTIDGKIWDGETHKDESGRLMTGKVHTEESEYLYHAI